MPARPPMRAVAFAYHNVGVRCLSALLAGGVDVPLVVTHRDTPGENIWFDSVATLCARAGIECLALDKPDSDLLAARLRALRPQYLFSFYFRHMLPVSLLGLASAGAFNMHGSLLPRYRGRVPVNWAVLHGERETGATLHEMTAKPDAGDIVDQQAVPILPNDTAFEAFHKVTVAAEMVMCRVLPAFQSGTVPRRRQDLAQGSYFGGRTPADGRIDWSRDAWNLHNLVRAVAPPYPGAFGFVGARRLGVLRTWWPERAGASPAAFASARASAGAPARGSAAAPAHAPGPLPAALVLEGEAMHIRCADGARLPLLQADIDGQPLAAGNFLQHFGEPIVIPS
jgi:methionyl-tRNA formyltransferase